MGWFVAPAIVALNREIASAFPGRDTATDGVIGDASHQARPSDHNPCWTCSGSSYGIVRATDRDDDGWPAVAVRDYIIDLCRRGIERRLAYVIHNRTIWSATYGWAARSYTGSNTHESHIHFSLARDASNFDTGPWISLFATPHIPHPPTTGEDDEMTPADWNRMRSMLQQECADGAARALQAYLAGQPNQQFTAEEVAAIKGLDPRGGLLGDLFDEGATA